MGIFGNEGNKIPSKVKNEGSQAVKEFDKQGYGESEKTDEGSNPAAELRRKRSACDIRTCSRSFQ